MALRKKPYLIIPKLIEQPTWGGGYILNAKNWQNNPFLKGKKIGQSYELFGQSKLLLSINDSRDSHFVPEFGYADKAETVKDHFPYKEGVDYITLAHEVAMPLLIKFTQAAGNSFQLHIKPKTRDSRWKAKPESWYYFEPGYLTLGLREGCDVAKYKETCVEINNHMRTLSEKVKKSEISFEEAKKNAENYIGKANPWQFVNRYEVGPDTLIDLSMGGVHHSWEENKKKYPLGNVVYEVQLDVMDPVSTIRSFDQGKLKNDGSIRPLNIDDYFIHLDRDPTHNAYDFFVKRSEGNHLLKTAYYNLDSYTISSPMTDHTGSSFSHLFVREGVVRITAKDGEATVSQGHSVFVPQETGEYQIVPLEKKTVVLKTYV